MSDFTENPYQRQKTVKKIGSINSRQLLKVLSFIPGFSPVEDIHVLEKPF